MTKRNATALPGRPIKRAKSGREPVKDLTHGLSIAEQAKPYLLITAKFPLDALTSVWSVGSNRPLDPEHVETLCRIFEKQKLQREPEGNRLRVACSKQEIHRILDQRPSDAGWPFFQGWMSVNGGPAEIMAGQHRVAALKALAQKNLLHTSKDDELWWLCDVYDKGTFPPVFIGRSNLLIEELPPRLDFLLRANRLDHTLPDTHGQVWMQLTTLAQQDPKLFQGTNREVEKEMDAIANLTGREEFPIRRMVTLWKNDSWKTMIGQWCSTAVGRSAFNISLWGDLARFRIDDVSYFLTLDISLF